MRLLFLVSASSLLLLGSAASAQDAATTPAPNPAAPASAPTAATDDELGDSELGRTGLLSDEQALYEERYGVGARPDRRSPHERPGVSYWSFGGSYRHSFMPRRIIELFVAEAPRGVQIPQFSLEVDRRRDGVDLILGLHYADYSFEGPFRSRNNSPDTTEILTSSMRTISADVSVLWSANFGDVVALQYGLDFGLGAFFGDVFRTEAYPSTGGPHTQSGWAACVGPTSAGTPGTAQAGDPFAVGAYAPPLNDVSAFCGAPNDTNPAGGYTDGDVKGGQQYHVRARSMLDGGHVPFFSWRLAPRLSLRIKPIRQIIMRLDAGFDFGSGVFLGAGLQYGF